MSNPRADIVVRRPGGGILALVEVKNLPRLGPGEALQLRDELLSAERAVDRPTYLMIVTQRRGFIWGKNGHGDWLPPEQFDMDPILREYLGEAAAGRHMRGTELEIIIANWLAELSRGRGFTSDQVGTEAVVTRFLADVRGAEVQFGALA